MRGLQLRRLLFPLCAVLLALAGPAAAQLPLTRAGRDGSKPTTTLSGVTINGANPTVVGYLTGATGNIQAQIDAVNAAFANYVALTGAQTIAGVKTFSSPPVMSGASISATSIEVGSLAFSATRRMFPDVSLALANVMIAGDGTSWANTASAPANWLLTSGTTKPQWLNSLTGITISGATNTLTNIPAGTALTGQVPVANGGTNKASWTVGSIPVATASTTIGEIAPSTSGHVLTSNGAGSAPTMQAPVTDTTVTATLSSTTWTSTSFVDTGQKITLPSGGKWLLTFRVRNYCQVSSAAPGVNSFELYDATAAAAITDSQTFGAADYLGGGSGFSSTTILIAIVDVASGRDIKLYVKRLSGPVYASTGMACDNTEGACTATAVLLRK